MTKARPGRTRPRGSPKTTAPINEERGPMSGTPSMQRPTAPPAGNGPPGGKTTPLPSSRPGGSATENDLRAFIAWRVRPAGARGTYPATANARTIDDEPTARPARHPVKGKRTLAQFDRRTPCQPLRRLSSPARPLRKDALAKARPLLRHEPGATAHRPIRKQPAAHLPRGYAERTASTGTAALSAIRTTKRARPSKARSDSPPYAAVGTCAPVRSPAQAASARQRRDVAGRKEDRGAQPFPMERGVAGCPRRKGCARDYRLGPGGMRSPAGANGDCRPWKGRV
jgi:hypothetical protein